MILSNLITAKTNLLFGIFIGVSICILNKKLKEKINKHKENGSSVNN